MVRGELIEERCYLVIEDVKADKMTCVFFFEYEDGYEDRLIIKTTHRNENQ